MEENLITITVNNYKGKKLTFTALADATVEIWKTKSTTGKNKGKLIETKIILMNYGGIKAEEEDI